VDGHLASGVMPGATAALDESTDVEIASLTRELARAHPGDFRRRLAQLRQTGHCRLPIRLRGETFTQSKTGTLRTRYSTRREPGGVMLVRCRNRRAAICPSCAWEYQGDVWQLIYAGLAGGRKGVPAEVATHPMVFVTLTAPSFGAVHTRRPDGSCHPSRGRQRDDRAMCVHGRPLRCDAAEHSDGDPCLGTPLCPDCYDYQGAVRFNWHAPELWRRFVIAVRRELAKSSGVSESEFSGIYRLSFAKVAEFQRRGVVHFHAILRLDGAGDAFASAPVGLHAAGLCAAAGTAAQRVWINPDGDSAGRIRFGGQVVVREVRLGEDGVPADAVAAYLAKYATKSADDLDDATNPGDVLAATYGVSNEHHRRMAATAQLIDVELVGAARWAHMFGFRGHFSSKSRTFSTTMGALRAARVQYRQERRRRSRSPALGVWRFEGAGHRSRAERALAVAMSSRTGRSRVDRRNASARWAGRDRGGRADPRRPAGSAAPHLRRPDAAATSQTKAGGGWAARAGPRRE
jgi:hypothetical protein